MLPPRTGRPPPPPSDPIKACGGAGRRGLQVKETVLALVALLSDLKMDTHVLMNLVRQLKDPFRKLLLLAFEGECRRIVQGETYQPLEVQVRPLPPLPDGCLRRRRSDTGGWRGGRRGSW